MDFPPFHPDWLVNFWLTTTGINKLNPHLVLITLLVTIAGVYFYKRKQSMGKKQDTEEVHFQYLIKKKTMLEDKLTEITTECKHGNISKEVFLKKKTELEKHLELTRTELQQYIV